MNPYPFILGQPALLAGAKLTPNLSCTILFLSFLTFLPRFVFLVCLEFAPTNCPWVSEGGPAPEPVRHVILLQVC